MSGEAPTRPPGSRLNRWYAAAGTVLLCLICADITVRLFEDGHWLLGVWWGGCTSFVFLRAQHS